MTPFQTQNTIMPIATYFIKNYLTIEKNKTQAISAVYSVTSLVNLENLTINQKLHFLGFTRFL